MKKILTSYLLFALMFPVQAQKIIPYDEDLLTEYYTGRLPGTRYEAMGKAEAIIGNSPFSIHANPATVGRVQKFAFDVSRAAPFFYVRTGRYNYLGGAFRVHKHWVVGLDWHRFNNNSNEWEFRYFNKGYDSDKPTSGITHLAIANTSVKNLNLGLSVSMLVWNYLHTMPKSYSYMVNMGGIYDILINKGDTSQKIMIGASVTNLNKSFTEFGAPDIPLMTQKYLPRIFRAGIGFSTNLNIKMPGMNDRSKLTATCEYQDVLNSDFRTGIKAGVELLLVNILAIRGGYYKWNENPQGGTYFDTYKSLTYGFGFKIPMGKLCKLNNGWTIDVDYTALPQHAYEDRSRYFNSFRSFGLKTEFPLGFKKNKNATPTKSTPQKQTATPSKPPAPKQNPAPTPKPAAPSKPKTPAKPKTK